MNFELLAQGLDVSPLLAALDAQPQLWDAITIRQDWPGSPHHDTRCIWLRGPERIAPDTIFDDLQAHDYGALPLLMPAIGDLLTPILQGLRVATLGRVMIVDLKAGGRIDPHSDEGAYAAHFERFHLCLQSDEGNTFMVNGEIVHMLPGQLWTFDHRSPHEVHNDSGRPRIHLIFDATRWGAPT